MSLFQKFYKIASSSQKGRRRLDAHPKKRYSYGTIVHSDHQIQPINKDLMQDLMQDFTNFPQHDPQRELPGYELGLCQLEFFYQLNQGNTDFLVRIKKNIRVNLEYEQY